MRAAGVGGVRHSSQLGSDFVCVVVCVCFERQDKQSLCVSKAFGCGFSPLVCLVMTVKVFPLWFLLIFLQKKKSHGDNILRKKENRTLVTVSGALLSSFCL